MALTRILVLVLLSIPLASCEPRIPKAIEAQGKPVRVLSVLIVLDEGVGLAEAKGLIAEVNPFLIRQAGLALRPIAHCVIRFPGPRDRAGMLRGLYEATVPFRDQFDLFIGFARKTPLDRFKRLVIGDWLGVIDDTYRRYIVIKELDRRVLLHEVYHAFIQTAEHSECGVMSTLLELLPGVAMNYSLNLCEDDRSEVLANRGRRFDRTPWPPAGGGPDLLATN